jgi:hypothetical protein
MEHYCRETCRKWEIKNEKLCCQTVERTESSILMVLRLPQNAITWFQLTTCWSYKPFSLALIHYSTACARVSRMKDRWYGNLDAVLIEEHFAHDVVIQPG